MMQEEVVHQVVSFGQVTIQHSLEIWMDDKMPLQLRKEIAESTLRQLHVYLVQLLRRKLRCSQSMSEQDEDAELYLKTLGRISGTAEPCKDLFPEF